MADFRSKVVVRSLPPNLTEQAFREAAQEWLDKADWCRYAQGRSSVKEIVPSRAYLNLRDPRDAVGFKQQWEGRIFVNERGAQFRCSVEYAAYQKAPRQRCKRDPKEGTIERDTDYQDFLRQLQAGGEQLPTAAQQLQEREAAAAGSPGLEGAVVVTALMQFVQDKRAGNTQQQQQQQQLAIRGTGKSSRQAAQQGGKGSRTNAVAQGGTTQQQPTQQFEGAKVRKKHTVTQQLRQATNSKRGSGRQALSIKEGEHGSVPAGPPSTKTQQRDASGQKAGGRTQKATAELVAGTVKHAHSMAQKRKEVQVHEVSKNPTQKEKPAASAPAQPMPKLLKRPQQQQQAETGSNRSAAFQPGEPTTVGLNGQDDRDSRANAQDPGVPQRARPQPKIRPGFSAYQPRGAPGPDSGGGSMSSSNEGSRDTRAAQDVVGKRGPPRRRPLKKQDDAGVRR